MKQNLNDLPRGMRNNNPLNIRRNQCNRWKGAVYPYPQLDPDFEEFYELKYGYRAFFVLLFNYKRFYGIETIHGIIYHFAPPEDKNDTAAYVRFVCRFMGVDSDYVPSNESEFVRLALAMTMVENGVKLHYDVQPIIDGYKMAVESKFVKLKKGGV